MANAEIETASRQYASFLLRLWLTSPNGSDENATESMDELPLNIVAIEDEQSSNLVLQVQHLQTGLVWRVSTLEELNKLLMLAIKDNQTITYSEPTEH